MTDQDTIFVQIASYRDSELQHTLQDLFNKAKNPDRIFVGICHQYDMQDGEDEKFFEIPFPRPDQLRVIDVDYRQTKGCCWARGEVQKLYEGEKWTLSIDSHMKFEENWDEICISTCNELIDQGYKPILSTYVCGYEIGKELNGHTANFGVHFNHYNIIEGLGGMPLDLSEPLSHSYFAGGFAFVSAEFIDEVMYDSDIFFIGEEITIAVRAWTSGYDLFVPHKIIAYHLYGKFKDDPKTSWQDSPEIVERNELSFAKVRHITQIKVSNDKRVLNNMSQYSLGKKRTLKDYERFSGIDFRQKKIRKRAHKGIFMPWQDVTQTEEISNLFKKIN